jgi:branched-chain amino acid transport system substrate-binding protein
LRVFIHPCNPFAFFLKRLYTQCLIIIIPSEVCKVKKIFLLFVFLVSIALLASGCQKSGEPVIKVGVIAELTGSIPAVGASCKNAALLAAKEINDAGGIEINGKKYKIELSIEDSAARPDQAAAVAQKLITQQKVVAIVGPNSSGNAIPASEIAETMKVPLITPWSTEPKTTINQKTGQPKQYVFRACFTDVFEGQALGKFASETLKKKRAAVLYDVGSDVLKSQAELFRKSFEAAGGKTVAFETYTSGDKDFSAQLTKIRDAEPDVIFLPSYYTDVPLQVQQAYRLGVKVPFLGSDAWSTPELIKMCGNDCEGFYFMNHYSPETKNPMTKKFADAYKAMHGSVPDDIAALTYDAFGLLAEALKKSAKLDAQSIRDSLAAIRDYKGVTGEMQFSEGSGDPRKGAVIMQIRNGNFAWFADTQP